MDIDVLKRILVSSYIWTFVCQIHAAVFGIAVDVLLVRMLPPLELGAYLLIFSIVTLLSMACMFGQQRVIARVISEALAANAGCKIRAAVTKAVIIVDSFTLVIVMLLSTFGEDLIDLMLPTGLILYMIILLALLLIVSAGSTMLAETFRGFHQVRNDVLFNDAQIRPSPLDAASPMPHDFMGMTKMWDSSGMNSIIFVQVIQEV